MRPTSLTIIRIVSFSMILSLTIIGCSNPGSNPILNSMNNRSGELFAGSFPILGSPANPAFSVDLATAVRGKGWAGLIGEPAEIHGHTWTAAVSQRLADGWTIIDDPTLLSFRWLYEKVEATINDPQEYPELEIDPGLGENYRTPHVDAISHWQLVPYTLYNEVAICYRYRDTQHGDTDIGVTRLRFDHTELWPEEGLQGVYELVEHYSVPDPVIDDVEYQSLDFFPDIAYDPDTADIYLVWTRQMDYLGDPEQYMVHWMKFDRNDPNSDMDGHWVITDDPANDPQPLAQRNTHNGWTPRVDVGTTHGVTAPQISQGRNVVLAYTTQYANGHNGFHPAVIGWPVTNEVESITSYELQLLDPTYGLESSGLPIVDISPETNPGNGYIAVTFMQDQVIGVQGNEYHITLWNSINPEEYNYFGLLGESIYPTVAIHSESAQQTDNVVSLSYFSRDIFHALVPIAQQFNITTHEVGQLTLITGGANGVWVLEEILAFQWGMNCSISVLDDQRYWLAWSDTAGHTGYPRECWATIGFTE
ncbi:MAG TPA: hypothetical protein VGB30_05610 [bacterium]|jgi:hypothetical protein